MRGSVAATATHLAKLAATVLLTFAVLWGPFCAWPAAGESCLQGLAHGACGVRLRCSPLPPPASPP